MPHMQLCSLPSVHGSRIIALWQIYGYWNLGALPPGECPWYAMELNFRIEPRSIIRRNFVCV